MAERQEIPEWYSGKGKKGDDAECNSLSQERLNTSIDTSKKKDKLKFTPPVQWMSGRVRGKILDLLLCQMFICYSEYSCDRDSVIIYVGGWK